MNINTLNMIDELYKESIKSIIHHQLAAIIFKGNKILSKPCCNLPKSTSKNIADGIIYGSIHAEAHAILNYYGKNFYYNKNKKLVYLPQNLKKHSKLDLMVARFNKNGSLCNSRPCYNCLQLMKIVGIRKVYYTTADGIICEDVDKMISIQLSSSIVSNKSIDFHNSLLISQFSQKIYDYNLQLFIKYNLSNNILKERYGLPNYNYSFYKYNKTKYFIIYYQNNIVINTIIY